MTWLSAGMANDGDRFFDSDLLAKAATDRNMQFKPVISPPNEQIVDKPFAGFNLKRWCVCELDVAPSFSHVRSQHLAPHPIAIKRFGIIRHPDRHAPSIGNGKLVVNSEAVNAAAANNRYIPFPPDPPTRVFRCSTPKTGVILWVPL